MTNPARMPPPEIARAAGQVQAWLDEQNPTRLSREQIDKLTPAQRLDYSRLWDQSKMPEWRDPRG